MDIEEEKRFYTIGEFVENYEKVFHEIGDDNTTTEDLNNLTYCYYKEYTKQYLKKEI